MSSTSRRRLLPALLVALLTGAVALLLLALAPADATRVSRATGTAPVIVKITGTAANGFTIRYRDGSVDYPPTDSEAHAECSAYETRVARVRCNTEVRTWYRDLADTQRAIRYALTR